MSDRDRTVICVDVQENEDQTENVAFRVSKIYRLFVTIDGLICRMK